MVGDRYDVSRHSGDDALSHCLQYPAGQAAACDRSCDGDEWFIELIACQGVSTGLGVVLFSTLAVAKIEVLS